MTNVGGSIGYGTIFSINIDGSGFGLLHTFTFGAGDGGYPYGSLTLSGSKFYGMTSGAGGMIFSVNMNGTGFSQLHSFTGGSSDGSSPVGSLTLSGAKLYGMTNGGGGTNAGTIFSVNTNGTGYSLLHTFGGSADGYSPFGSLTQSGSTFYGITEYGGSTNAGTVFGVNTDGTGYGILQNFARLPTDGAFPIGDVTLSGDAQTLYGMTSQGGTADSGVIFSVLVPEPSAALLLAAGAGLLLRRRRG